ncbi:LapA family protein [Larkinella soli]|uniref:LapA family protein n=1 Tax=Larkinella soli TaxID=1770527 RepID=UPI000FFB47DB|nr:LapA family protein [Larkinella soli]
MNMYWKTWALSCALGELLGIGAAGAIAVAFNHLLGEPGTTAGKALNMAVMVSAGVLEGSLLGWFQWRVLRLRFPRIPAREWISYTVFVAAGGWLLGMAIPLFFSANNPTQKPLAEPPLAVVLLMSMLMGLILGGLFGAVQWLVFRKYARNTFRWIYANALGWSVGMLWIFVAATLPDARTPGGTIIVLGIIGGILAGLSVGGVTGWFLKRIVAENPQPSPPGPGCPAASSAP